MKIEKHTSPTKAPFTAGTTDTALTARTACTKQFHETEAAGALEKQNEIFVVM
jgi:hypothetical protein